MLLCVIVFFVFYDVSCYCVATVCRLSAPTKYSIENRPNPVCTEQLQIQSLNTLLGPERVNLYQFWCWHENKNITNNVNLFCSKIFFCFMPIRYLEEVKEIIVFVFVNNFKTSLSELSNVFFPAPPFCSLICEAERQSSGELQKSTQIPPAPTSDKSYLNCSHFSRSQQTTVSDVSEKEKGKKANCVVSCACLQMRFA